jgi:hypothetical protein
MVTVVGYPGGFSFNCLTMYPNGIIAMRGQFTAKIAEGLPVELE